MGQKEMKVLKFPSRHQRYYFSFMESFGWDVQEFHEMVDGSITYSSGSTSSYNFGSFHGNTQHFRGGNMSHFSGHTWDFGESYDSGTEITEVTTSFTVTFVRDRDIPHKAELDQIEQRFHNLTPAYFKRLDKIHIFFKDIPEEQWPEWQAVLACSNDAWAVRRRPVQQSPTRQVSAPKTTTQKRVSAPKPVVNKDSTSVVKPTPKKPVKKFTQLYQLERPSFEEYAAEYCKEQNLDKNTKGLDVFLKGLECWYAKYSYENAIKYFKEAIEINPKEPHFWIWVAEYHHHNREMDKMIALYQKALKELPNNPKILTSLSYAYLWGKDPDNAKKYLKNLTKNLKKYDVKTQITIYRLTGNIHEFNEEYEKAMQFYDMADSLIDSNDDKTIDLFQRLLKDKMNKLKTKN